MEETKTNQGHDSYSTPYFSLKKMNGRKNHTARSSHPHQASLQIQGFKLKRGERTYRNWTDGSELFLLGVVGYVMSWT
jgi:hypothetical protein